MDGLPGLSGEKAMNGKKLGRFATGVVLCAAAVLSIVPEEAHSFQRRMRFRRFPFNQREFRRAIEMSDAGGQPADAVAAQSPAEPTSDELLQRLLSRLEKSKALPAQLRPGKIAVPAEKKDQTLVALLESVHLGYSYSNAEEGGRFVAARILLVNLTPDPITLKRSDLAISVDGSKGPLDELPANGGAEPIVSDGRTYTLQNLKPPAELTVPSAGTAALWAVSLRLPARNAIPQLAFHYTAAGNESTLDINAFALRLLGLEVEHVGPQNCLALLTISGEVNTVNLGALIDVLDKEAAQKIGRVVIRWSPTAAALGPSVSSWFVHAADQAGRGEVEEGEELAVPAAIRELHLAALPRPNATPSPDVPPVDNSDDNESDEFDVDYSPYLQSPTNVHTSELDAVTAALHSAYAALSTGELLKEIETGHPLTWAAALATGGGRLPEEKLSVLLGYADADDPSIRQAALAALRHFGRKEAIDKLLECVKKNVQPMSRVAAESLAASRYTAAHRALLDLLRHERPELKQSIVAVLARYPKPIWSDALFEFASNPRSPLCVDAVAALERIGHPQLVAAYRGILAEGSDEAKSHAFALLVRRSDAQSEQLALDYTLAHLQKSLPTRPMRTLLMRTKDPRATALLIEHLRKTSERRMMLINLLDAMGDESIVGVFVGVYPSLDSAEKSQVLTTLERLHAPQFMQLAREAVLSPDFQLVNAAAEGLRRNGGQAAVALLIEAFESTTSDESLDMLASSLSALGTPEARQALIKARTSGDAKRQQVASYALRELRQRLPGMNYVHHAQYLAHEKKWDEAEKQFSMALKLNPDLPEAYTGRGNVLLKREKFALARKDFEKSLEIEPNDGQAITGLGICLVEAGEIDRAVKLVEDGQKDFKDDAYFAYNSGCVYGRAVGYLKKHTDKEIADRDKKTTEYQTQSVKYLMHSVSLGFRDAKWLKEDPDLKPLHNLPEFGEVVAAAEKAAKERPLEDEFNF